MSTRTLVSPTPAVASTTASRRAWLLLLLAVVALMGVRLPAITALIREQVDTAIASGELAGTDQRQLAVSIGVSVALALSTGVLLVLVAAAHRVEPRLRLPAVRVSGRHVPGLLLVVGSGLLAKQLASIVVGPSGRAFDPAVLGVVGVSVAVAVTAVAASTGRGRPRRRALAVGLVVGLATAVI